MEIVPMNMQQPKLVLCELEDAGLPGVESYSPFCLKVHRALRAAGLAYERRFANRPDAWKRFNPTGQVPVLLVGDDPVNDSTRILQRIEEMTGALARGLDARSRAEAWLWEEFADSALSGFVMSARWADDRNWPGVRDNFFGAAPWFVRKLIVPKLRKRLLGVLVARDVTRQGLEACWQRFGCVLDQLEARAPAQGFWVSETLSIADLALFGQLQSFRTPLTQPQAAELARRPRLSAYLDRVDASTRVARLAEHVREARAV
jgi:glutathione S-transferase